MIGKIKTLVRDRKFGFIEVEGQADVFFHQDSLQGVSYDELNEGDSLSFDVEKTVKDGKERSAARNVQRAS